MGFSRPLTAEELIEVELKRLEVQRKRKNKAAKERRELKKRTDLLKDIGAANDQTNSCVEIAFFHHVHHRTVGVCRQDFCGKTNDFTKLRILGWRTLCPDCCFCGGGVDIEVIHEIHHCGGKHDGVEYEVKHCECGLHVVNTKTITTLVHAPNEFPVTIRFGQRCKRSETGWWHLESGKVLKGGDHDGVSSLTESALKGSFYREGGR